MASLQEVGLAVKRLQWRHHRETNRLLLSRVGLSLVQWDVLRHLHEQPDASLHSLAELTFQTDQSMGELAKRMVSKGLLERIEGPGRVVRHESTPDGTRAFQAGSGVADEVLTDTVGRLSVDERNSLNRLLLKSAGAASVVRQ